MNRIPSLDGMRALSVLMVLASHITLSNGSPIRENYWTATYAHYGVCIFFVISGFLITTILEKERASTGRTDVKQFYVRRAYRILPVAYLFLAVMVLTHLRSIRWGQAAAVAAYVSSYIDWHKLPFCFQHLWSLSVEEQFYLLWPLALVIGLSKRFAWAAVVIAPISRFIFGKMGNEHYSLYTFPSVADSLATGCLLALYQPEIRKYYKYFTTSNFWLAFVAMLGLPVVSEFMQRSHIHLIRGLVGNSMWTSANLAAALCIQIAVVAKPKVLNLKPVVYLGVLSYSLYIWQMPLMDPGSGLWLARFPVNILATLVVAAASYHLVEKPILDLRNKRAKRRNVADQNGAVFALSR